MKTTARSSSTGGEFVFACKQPKSSPVSVLAQAAALLALSAQLFDVVRARGVALEVEATIVKNYEGSSVALDCLTFKIQNLDS